jgi:hypothetical protein
LRDAQSHANVLPVKPKMVNADDPRCWQDNPILTTTDEQSLQIARYRYAY